MATKKARTKAAVPKRTAASKKVAASKKPTLKKLAPKKLAPQERDNLIKVRAHVDDIEKRLKRANSLTRSSVRALQKSYESLGARSGGGGNLAAPIAELSARLTGLIEKTRTDVAHDLRVVMEDPRLETVNTALNKANERLTRAERAQADAISAINTQIADLAVAVDNRMARESRERERVQEVLSNRINEVENISAEAMLGIGDKVAQVTEELTRRAGEQAENLIVTAADQAKEQQLTLDEHKSEMERRIEAIEDDQRNTIPSIERRLVTLSSRLEELESFEPVAFQPGEMVMPQLPPVPVYDAAPLVESEVAAPSMQAPLDAFSPSEPVEFKSVAPPQNPYGMQAPEVSEVIAQPIAELNVESAVSEGQQLEEYQPQEYQPQEYQPQEYQAQEYQPQDYQAAAHQMQIGGQPQVYAPPLQGAQVYEPAQAHDQAQPFEYAPQPDYAPETAAPVMPPFAETPPAEMGLPPMPLEAIGAMEMDGAAELSMDAQRPGAEPKKKKRGFKLKKFGGSGDGNGGGSGKSSPLKLFALMAGVAAVGLFAATKVMPDMLGGKAENSSATMQDGYEANVTEKFNAIAEELEAGPSSKQELLSEAPIGDYAQTMKAPDLGEAADGGPSTQALTLEAAAADGNPVAQFQLGLSHLEAGRDADAVRLIRLAANQGQPAAQYRLGKLYEAGIGVQQNPKTAMELLALAAKGGNSVAMHDLGHYYAIGAQGREANINQAATWFHKAAERGIVDSQFNLGVLYMEGSGVKRDLVQSYVWFSLAAAQGDKIAKQRVEMVGLDLSKQQQAQANARLKAFAPKRVDEAANGIFRNTPWVVERTTESGPATTVKSAQQMLAHLGYDVGTPDGAMGPKTRNAVISFERANGLPETGRVDRALIKRLSLAAGV